MISNRLIITDKHLDTIALALQNRFLALEGPAQTSKTTAALFAFHYRVLQSPHYYQAICGRNLDSIRDNLIQGPKGLITQFPNYYELKKDKIGGYFLDFQNGKKRILLASYSDTSKWKNILGKTIDVFLIDEANISDETFFNETFSRQQAVDDPCTIVTTNGDDPEHWLYQKHINHSVIYGDAPSSTLAYMKTNQEGKVFDKYPDYAYQFYAMKDNPIMTDKMILNASRIYPVKSHYYITKFLGERGAQGELLFTDYLSPKLFVNKDTKLNGKNLYSMISFYSIGVDIGGNRASTVFTLTGWFKDKSRAIILKVKDLKDKGYEVKKRKLKEFVKQIQDEGKFIKYISVDSAESNAIFDWKEEFKKELNVEVIASYKATIKERCDMMTIGFSTRRILFDESCGLTYQSYMGAKKSNKPSEYREDLNELKNDVMDSTEYSLTTHMKEFMLKGGDFINDEFD